MRDDRPMTGVISVLLPLAVVAAAGWIAVGSRVQDALFAALKLVVTR